MDAARDRQSADSFPHAGRREPRGRRRFVRSRARPDTSDRRRKRLRQVGYGAFHPAARPAAARQDCRQDPVRGRGSPEALRTRHARHSRQPHRHGLPGADDRPQSGAARSAARSPSRCGCTSSSTARRWRSARSELLNLVGIAEPRRARGRLPAPAFRRHAAAGDDRHGARLRPEAPHRGRADHRPRRHHPGADPRPHRRPQRSGMAPPSSSSPTIWELWRRSPTASW